MKLFKSKFKIENNLEEFLKKAEIYLRYKSDYKPPNTTEREVKELNNFKDYLFDALLESPRKTTWGLRMYSIKYYILNFIESILIGIGISSIAMVILELLIFKFNIIPYSSSLNIISISTVFILTALITFIKNLYTESKKESKQAKKGVKVYTKKDIKQYKKDVSRNLTENHANKAKEYIKELLSTLDNQKDAIILKENTEKLLMIEKEFPVLYSTVLYELNQPLYNSLEKFQENYLEFIVNSKSDEYENNDVDFVIIYRNEMEKLLFFKNINNTIAFLNDYIRVNNKYTSRIKKIVEFLTKHKLIIQNNRLNTDKNKKIKEQYDKYMNEITSFEFIYLYFKSKYNVNAVHIFNKYRVNIDILNKYLYDLNILLKEDEIAKDLEDVNNLRINNELKRTVQNMVLELNNVIELQNIDESISKFDADDFNALADILDIQNEINEKTLVDNKIIEKTKILVEKQN